MYTQTESRSSFFFFFHANYGRFCIFRIFISAIPLGQKKRKTKPGFPFVGLGIINIVSKYLQIHCSEQGMVVT